MADEVHDKRFSQLVVDSFVTEQVAHVVQVARMLTVKGGDHLASVEVGKAHNGHFREAEFCFDALRHRSDRGFIDTAAQDWRDFNLDLRTVRADNQLSDGFLTLRRTRADFGSVNTALDLLCYPVHSSVDLLEGRCAVLDRKVCEINVDG